MDIIQYSAWSIDRALELNKINDTKKTVEQILRDADTFAQYMQAVVDKSGEIERQMDDEINRRVDIKLLEIKE
jgi:hypothetical protein